VKVNSGIKSDGSVVSGHFTSLHSSQIFSLV